MNYFFALALLYTILAKSPVYAHENFENQLFNIKLYTEIPGYDLQYKSINNGKSVKLNPNIAQLLGVRLGFKDWFSIGYGFKLQQLEKDKIKKGATDYQDWRFAFTFEHFVLILNYQEYLGFYYQDSKSIDPTWNSSLAYLQSPNLKLRNSSVNFTYIWSPEDYSLTAAMDQTVRQSKSAGSFLIGMAVAQTQFSDNGPIIPSLIRNQFGIDQNIEQGRFEVFILKGGYGYTLVWSENWFFSLAGQIGAGQQRRTYKDSSLERHGWYPSSKWDLLVSTGYNGEDFFAGIKVLGDATSYRTTSIEFSSGLWAASLFIGGRF